MLAFGRKTIYPSFGRCDVLFSFELFEVVAEVTTFYAVRLQYAVTHGARFA